MKNIFKHIIPFILPLTVLIVIPILIEVDKSIKNLAAFIAGLFLIAVGILIMAITNISIIRIGKGTLANWSPTRKLVIVGLYRYVRNPMIIGVLIVLAGESLGIMSLKILIWAGIFFLSYNVYSIFFEEPNLKKRFGEDYAEYKKRVPRWIPKLKAYRPVGADQ